MISICDVILVNNDPSCDIHIERLKSHVDLCLKVIYN